MNSKDRVRSAINREQPDRVPRALWGSYYTLNEGAYTPAIRYKEVIGTTKIRERLTTPQIRREVDRLLRH